VKAKLIGVFPYSERASRSSLFAVLEEVFEVRFEGRRDGDHAGLDGAVLLPGADPAEASHLPRLLATVDEGPVGPLPPLGKPPAAAGVTLSLGETDPLDRRLRGARLRDESVEGVPGLDPAPAEVVLARRGRDAVWTSRTGSGPTLDRVAVAPAELAADEALRDRVRNGRFLAMVALVSFLRAVCRDVAWQAPPLRATFLFDDPNLHWTSYGYLRFPQLVAEADRHGYHVAMAMVPIDGWFVHPAAGRLFRDRADRLSLVVHGNNHERLELARPTDAMQAQRMLIQAAGRIASFERRWGVPVSRIMVAPHGVCSRDLARALVPLGFDGLSISRPYPWLARPPFPWLKRPEGSSALAGWHPAAVVENGLPVLLRRGINDPVEDLCLRAFLDQPLIIEAHHDDMRQGIDQLGEVAQMLAALGDVRWESLGRISASNVMTRRDGDSLSVRMFTRRAEVQIPAGVESVTVEVPSLEGPSTQLSLEWEGAGAAGTGHTRSMDAAPRIPVPEGLPSLQIRLVAGERPLPALQPLPAWPLKAVARRIACEGRDRIAPLRGRITGLARAHA
jgi:hypothetical protein